MCDLKSTELLLVLIFQKLLKLFRLCYFDSTNIKCQFTHSGVCWLATLQCAGSYVVALMMNGVYKYTCIELIYMTYGTKGSKLQYPMQLLF